MHDGELLFYKILLLKQWMYSSINRESNDSSEMGTRHRAALGISEESDAIVIIISEEKGSILTAENGRFTHLDHDEMTLRRYLNERLFISSEN